MALEHERAPAATGQQVQRGARAAPAVLGCRGVWWVSLGQGVVPNSWEQVVEALLDWLIHEN